MNETGHRDLYDRVLWAMESTLFGHHPAAAQAVTSRIGHLNFTAGREQAIEAAAAALNEFTPLFEEAAVAAVCIVDRLALDEPKMRKAAA